MEERDGATLYTSAEVAKRLGLHRVTLVRYVIRHPELRPAMDSERLGANFYMWTEAEIERLIQYREKPRAKKQDK